MAGLDPAVLKEAQAVLDDPKIPEAKKAPLRALVQSHAPKEEEDDLSPFLDDEDLGEVYSESDRRKEDLAKQRAGIEGQMSEAKAKDDAYAAEHPTMAKVKDVLGITNQARTGLGVGFNRPLMQSMAANGDPGAERVAAAPGVAEKVGGAATGMGLGALLGPGGTLMSSALKGGAAAAGGAYAGSRVAEDPALETARKTAVAGGVGSLLGGLFGLPAAAMRKLRANPTIGDDIVRAEGKGYETTLGGAMRKPGVAVGPRPLEREAANVAPDVEKAVTARDAAMVPRQRAEVNGALASEEAGKQVSSEPLLREYDRLIRERSFRDGTAIPESMAPRLREHLPKFARVRRVPIEEAERLALEAKAAAGPAARPDAKRLGAAVEEESDLVSGLGSSKGDVVPMSRKSASSLVSGEEVEIPVELGPGGRPVPRQEQARSALIHGPDGRLAPKGEAAAEAASSREPPSFAVGPDGNATPVAQESSLARRPGPLGDASHRPDIGGGYIPPGESAQARARRQYATVLEPRRLNASDLEHFRNTMDDAGRIEQGGGSPFLDLSAKAREMRAQHYPGLDSLMARHSAEVADMNRIKAAVGLKAGMSDTELSRVADSLTKYGAKGNLENDRAIQMLLAENPELAQRVEELGAMSAAERVRSYGSDGPTPMSKVGFLTHIGRGVTGNAVGMDPIMRLLAKAKADQFTAPVAAGDGAAVLERFTKRKEKRQ